MKKNMYLLVLIGLFIFSLVFPINVLADDYSLYEDTCSNPNVLQAFKLVGIIIQIVRIVAPLLIIGFGMYDFFKAFFVGDDKGIAKAVGSVIKKLIAGIAIFVLPSLLLVIINLVSDSTGVQENAETGNYVKCTQCLFSPSKYCN